MVCRICQIEHEGHLSKLKKSGRNSSARCYKDIRQINWHSVARRHKVQCVMQITVAAAGHTNLLQQHSDSISRHEDLIAACETNIQNIQVTQTELSSNIANIESRLARSMETMHSGNCASSTPIAPSSQAETMDGTLQSVNSARSPQILQKDTRIIFQPDYGPSKAEIKIAPAMIARYEQMALTSFLCGINSKYHCVTLQPPPKNIDEAKKRCQEHDSLLQTKQYKEFLITKSKP
ncbi:unnamed protein product [Acanthoscelides obtectus]|uniref:Uncharacterized protein n=1 Tax=Acanthoscelides obtectus TaxID=200917 RepID=A0A9P0LHN3_ACAOB|nr:unnamed protein product [Acanthoscelides obtectus]CAK1686118.1 hypothetical protein AOBTE_LOCUS35792 [Acanthoscelides obtectus]